MILAMKRIMIACLMLAAAAPAAAAERTYMVVDFDKIRVEGPYQVTLSTGVPTRAVATGPQGALERVSIEVQGTTLYVRANRSAWGGYPGEGGGVAKISISTRALRSATVIGAGTLAIDRAQGLRVDLLVSGSGRIGIAAVDADLLVASLNGSGKIALGGKAKQLRANISGSGDLDAASFRADNADIATDTSGSVALTAVRTAKVRANGTGEVAISGSAACTVTGPGTGGVSCGAR
jgi:hypothetical protein